MSVKKAVFRILYLGVLCLCGGLMAEKDPKELIFSCITIHTDKIPLEPRSILKKACKLNDADGCVILGDIYHNGESVTKNFKKALKYYSKSCELNNADGCSKLGGAYFFGEGVTKDLKKAFEYYSKACGLNDAKGCYALAVLYNEAKGVAKDEKQMTENLKKACELGLKEACGILKEQK
ncbi:tetratricopeptide repeat protein [Helicobacter pylori]|uniref:tetratricopeptide repeat protein n=1 Tax=Helicobacter pylori TaxID=210 RepID=UPI0030BCAE1A